MIVGGFNGSYTKDASIFNCKTNQIRKPPLFPESDIFAFQMPTIQTANNQMLTADWKTKRMIQYTMNQRFKFIKDLRQYEQ